jgi:hypothetical protein
MVENHLFVINSIQSDQVDRKSKVYSNKFLSTEFVVIQTQRSRISLKITEQYINLLTL